MAKNYFAVLILLPFLLSSCQSTPKENFAEIENGMDKQSVLSLMGSPDVTRRWNDLDRWIYNFDYEAQLDQGEVHFSHGSVVYKGSPPQPDVTAEEQDRLNERESAALNAKWDQEREARKNLYQDMESAIQKEAGRSGKETVE